MEKYRPEAILGFSETGHTYVLCDGETLLGMGGVRKTGEDECLIYGLFLTPEAIGKDTAFHATLEADNCIRSAAALAYPHHGGAGFMKRWAITRDLPHRVRRKDDGLFYTWRSI